MLTVTEVHIELYSGSPSLFGFASVVLDGALAIQGLRIVAGPASRGLFVEMPSRKAHDYCPACRGKNVVPARFCNWCGHRLAERRGVPDLDGKVRLHHNIVFPVHHQFRAVLERAVLRGYQAALGPGVLLHGSGPALLSGLASGTVSGRVA